MNIRDATTKKHRSLRIASQTATHQCQDSVTHHCPSFPTPGPINPPSRTCSRVVGAYMGSNTSNRTVYVRGEVCLLLRLPTALEEAAVQRPCVALEPINCPRSTASHRLNLRLQRRPHVDHIFGIRLSLAAHVEFLTSAARDEVLGPQVDKLAYSWTVNMKLDDTSSALFRLPIIASKR